VVTQTLELTLPSQIVKDLEVEVTSGKYANSAELISDVLQNYLDDRRIERLVQEGLADKDVTLLTKSDFAEMKSELIESFRN